MGEVKRGSPVAFCQAGMRSEVVRGEENGIGIEQAGKSFSTRSKKTTSNKSQLYLGEPPKRSDAARQVLRP